MKHRAEAAPLVSSPDNINIIINLENLKAAFETLPCGDSKCQNRVTITCKERYGLSVRFLLSCSAHCGWTGVDFWSSKKLDRKTETSSNSRERTDTAEDELDVNEILMSDDEEEAEKEVEMERKEEEEEEEEDKEEIELDGEYEEHPGSDSEDEWEDVDEDEADVSMPLRAISSTPTRDPRGAKGFDTNMRLQVAMREIGKGRSAMGTFCGLMNMHPPVKEKSYVSSKKLVREVFETAVERSMKTAAGEHEEDHITVSLDGSWQKRGHDSLNGIACMLSQHTGKVIDYQVETKRCHACAMWSEEKIQAQPAKYNQFRAVHACSISHTGSAGSMESKAAVDMFKRLGCN
jgi:hypothetical protein